MWFRPGRKVKTTGLGPRLPSAGGGGETSAFSTIIAGRQDTHRRPNPPPPNPPPPNPWPPSPPPPGRNWGRNADPWICVDAKRRLPFLGGLPKLDRDMRTGP